MLKSANWWLILIIVTRASFPVPVVFNFCVCVCACVCVCCMLYCISMCRAGLDSSRHYIDKHLVRRFSAGQGEVCARACSLCCCDH